MCVRDIEIIRDILESRTTFVFDFDGVLADSLEIKTWAFGEIYKEYGDEIVEKVTNCLLYTSPSPRDRTRSRMPSSA